MCIAHNVSKGLTESEVLEMGGASKTSRS